MPAPFIRFIRDRVCETQKELLRLMGESIVRENELALLIGKSIQTVERYVKALKRTGKIEFRGAPKNGGYYVISAGPRFRVAR